MPSISLVPVTAKTEIPTDLYSCYFLQDGLRIYETISFKAYIANIFFFKKNNWVVLGAVVQLQYRI